MEKLPTLLYENITEVPQNDIDYRKSLKSLKKELREKIGDDPEGCARYVLMILDSDKNNDQKISIISDYIIGMVAHKNYDFCVSVANFIGINAQTKRYAGEGLIGDIIAKLESASNDKNKQSFNLFINVLNKIKSE